MSSLPPPPPPFSDRPGPPANSVPPPPGPPAPPGFQTASAPSPKKGGLPIWGWIALGGVLAAGVVGAVVLTGDDDDGFVASATTARPIDTSPDSSELVITVPDSEPSSTPTDPASTDPSFVDPSAPAEVVTGAPEGITGDRDNPVPLGTVADIGGGWRMQVLEVVPDAAADVAAESEFNEPPPAGSTFTLVRVALGYFGVEDPISAFQPTISAVGGSSVELDSSCGTVPDQLDLFVDVFAGAVLTGNLCYVTTPDDSASLQLYAIGSYYYDTAQVFLTANGQSATEAALAPLAGPQAGAAATPGRLSPTAVSTAVDVGAGWTLTVEGAARDITDMVTAENDFNDPPPDGFRFIGVDVTYAYSGSEPAGAYAVITKAVGDGNVEMVSDCGVFASAIDTFSDVLAGGSVTGTLCFVVPTVNPTFVLYAAADFETARAFFSVT